jgi:hypothetical protein
VENERKGMRIGLSQKKDEDEKLLLEFRQVGLFAFRYSKHGGSLTNPNGVAQGAEKN